MQHKAPADHQKFVHFSTGFHSSSRVTVRSQRRVKRIQQVASAENAVRPRVFSGGKTGGVQLTRTGRDFGIFFSVL